MRADYRLPRLFVSEDLRSAAPIALTKEQSNYLLNVLRMAEGGMLLLFNGRDGEWRARLERQGKKSAILVPEQQTRAQPAAHDLHYLFAPLKVGRMDYMVQKAIEMGAGVLQPVQTQHTQMPKINAGRLEANMREAAEQCGILTLAELQPMQRIGSLLENWDESRQIIYCDEDAEGDDPLPILSALPRGPLAVLVGPEGGFSEDERRMLRALPFVTAIPLGPRILRADTAAVAALTLVQAVCGDWRCDVHEDDRAGD
ncbi:16S rRNA (uracil(1498)-N(3))-methyltransferase [Notoacmeibacter sp. MSK16QG-6]|uniref:16S rRNA (uracil(1498)-N(3))-methyltransferase n=1 Tax=Notoacmeibacter sp. MSK16QG-6 TaxID=2957982 RepID=UPI00209CACA1|nr:16S rRNA (uracil(1498)-N(3))-methyltransferase [Notoacmeibacter sp. MSK16QG-6]MCP1198534.1 16S rRNA (uracil(1498)-N(3))-methyltransferase [Notoacmeibacter sp. MSK16QG-6]